jgi:hypothetical protein
VTEDHQQSPVRAPSEVSLVSGVLQGQEVVIAEQNDRGLYVLVPHASPGGRNKGPHKAAGREVGRSEGWVAARKHVSARGDSQKQGAVGRFHAGLGGGLVAERRNAGEQAVNWWGCTHQRR